jgi:DNA-binding MarR family transcriptional regulator
MPVDDVVLAAHDTIDMICAMAVLANRDRILQVLVNSCRPLDDDELARRSDITPRQTVNRICRDLEQAGLLKRYTGPDGRIG